MQCNKGLIRLYLDYGGPSSYHVTHLYIFYILPEYVRETERERERGGERERGTPRELISRILQIIGLIIMSAYMHDTIGVRVNKNCIMNNNQQYESDFID